MLWNKGCEERQRRTLNNDQRINPRRRYNNYKYICTQHSEMKVTQLCLTLAIPWTVAHKGPLSMGFSRQEYWSGLPFPSLGIFPIQESNPCLLHCRQICDPMDCYSPWNSLGQNSGVGSLFPFSRGSSQPRDQTQVSCIAGGFFTSWATREARS